MQLEHPGHEAAQACKDSADRQVSNWSVDATEYLLKFAGEVREPFLVESARSWAHEHGLTDPPDQRAWGSVVRMLYRSGRLGFAGYRAAPSSNYSPKCLWVLM
jgi:hypothetical protein